MLMRALLFAIVFINTLPNVVWADDLDSNYMTTGRNWSKPVVIYGISSSYTIQTGPNEFSTENEIPRHDNIIVTDSASEPHIFFDNDSAILHVTKKAGVWSTESVATVNLPIHSAYPHEKYSSVYGAVVGNADVLHVGYRSALDGTIAYATNISGGWVTQTFNLSSVSYDAMDCAFTMKSTTAHFICRPESMNGFIHAIYNGRTWSKSTILADTTGVYPDVAVGSIGKKATPNPGNSFDNVVTPSGGLISTTSASDQLLHIAFFDPTACAVKYAAETVTPTGSVIWKIATIESFFDSTGTCPTDYESMYSSNYPYFQQVDGVANVGIAVDSANNAHIVFQKFYDSTFSSVVSVYANNVSGSWQQTSLLDNTVNRTRSGNPVYIFGELYSRREISVDGWGDIHIFGHQGNVTGCSSSLVADLEYVTNQKGSWDEEHFNYDLWGYVSPSGYADLDGAASLTVDNSGGLHAVFRDACSDELLYSYAPLEDTATTTFISTTGSIGQYTSLDIDTSDKIHITYYDESNTQLMYANNASGSWATAAVDSSDIVGTYTSLKVDAAGRIHIAYYKETGQELKYALYDSGSWSLDTVDTTSWTGTYNSLAVDSLGFAYISYFDAVNKDLKFATNATGSWNTETVDATDDVGSYTSIVLSDAGGVYISYYDTTSGNLKFAYRAPSATSWTLQTVDGSANNIGTFSSIALTDASAATPEIHIAYYDQTNMDLKYATSTDGTTWTTSTIDNSGNVGAYTSLTTDANDKLHVSYYDSTNGDLKYISNKGGTWYGGKITNETDLVGFYTSIGVDSTGLVHFSHHNYSSKDLMYTTF